MNADPSNQQPHIRTFAGDLATQRKKREEEKAKQTSTKDEVPMPRKEKTKEHKIFTHTPIKIPDPVTPQATVAPKQTPATIQPVAKTVTPTTSTPAPKPTTAPSASQAPSATPTPTERPPAFHQIHKQTPIQPPQEATAITNPSQPKSSTVEPTRKPGQVRILTNNLTEDATVLSDTVVKKKTGFFKSFFSGLFKKEKKRKAKDAAQAQTVEKAVARKETIEKAATKTGAAFVTESATLRNRVQERHAAASVAPVLPPEPEDEPETSWSPYTESGYQLLEEPDEEFLVADKTENVVVEFKRRATLPIPAPLPTTQHIPKTAPEANKPTTEVPTDTESLPKWESVSSTESGGSTLEQVAETKPEPITEIRTQTESVSKWESAVSEKIEKSAPVDEPTVTKSDDENRWRAAETSPEPEIKTETETRETIEEPELKEPEPDMKVWVESAASEAAHEPINTTPETKEEPIPTPTEAVQEEPVVESAPESISPDATPYQYEPTLEDAGNQQYKTEEEVGYLPLRESKIERLNTNTVALIVLAIVLVIATLIFGTLRLYDYVNKEEVVSPFSVSVEPLLPGSDVHTILVNSTNIEQLPNLLTPALAAGGASIVELPIVSLSGEEISAPYLFDVMRFNTLPSLQQSVTAARFISVDRGAPALYLHFIDRNTVFGGLLNWETNLANNFRLLYNIPQNTTATFVDQRIGNVSVRSLSTGNRVVLLYGFINEDTLVIAGDTNTFTRLLERSQ